MKLVSVYCHTSLKDTETAQQMDFIPIFLLFLKKTKLDVCVESR